MPSEQEAKIDEYSKVIEEEPDSVSVYLLRADCYRKMGRKLQVQVEHFGKVEQ